MNHPHKHNLPPAADRRALKAAHPQAQIERPRPRRQSHPHLHLVAPGVTPPGSGGQLAEPSSPPPSPPPPPRTPTAARPCQASLQDGAQAMCKSSLEAGVPTGAASGAAAVKHVTPAPSEAASKCTDEDTTARESLPSRPLHCPEKPSLNCSQRVKSPSATGTSNSFRFGT